MPIKLICKFQRTNEMILELNLILYLTPKDSRYNYDICHYLSNTIFFVEVKSFTEIE